MLNLRVHKESRTEPFIRTTGVNCLNSVNNDRVLLLHYSKYSVLVLPVVRIEPAFSRWFHLGGTFQPSNNHHVVLPAWISLTLSLHFSLSFIASGRSSGLHPVSSHSCGMYVRVSRPAFAWPYAGVHRSTSLISSSLLLQQCPVCLVHLTCIVFVMGSAGGHIVSAL